MPCQKFRACLENWYGASSLCLLPKKKKKNRAESEIPCVSGELARCQLLVLAASYIQKKKKIVPRQKPRACLENWYGASSLCLLPHKF